MKNLRCNATGCDRVVLEHRPIDFGLALVFCVEHALQFLREGGAERLAAAGFSGDIQDPSREDA